MDSESDCPPLSTAPAPATYRPAASRRPARLLALSPLHHQAYRRLQRRCTRRPAATCCSHPVPSRSYLLQPFLSHATHALTSHPDPGPGGTLLRTKRTAAAGRFRKAAPPAGPGPAEEEIPRHLFQSP